MSVIRKNRTGCEGLDRDPRRGALASKMPDGDTDARENVVKQYLFHPFNCGMLVAAHEAVCRLRRD